MGDAPVQRTDAGSEILDRIWIALSGNDPADPQSVWRTRNEYSYHEGEVARESIISPADIYYVDESETDKIRQSAKESVSPIFLLSRGEPMTPSRISPRRGKASNENPPHRIQIVLQIPNRSEAVDAQTTGDLSRIFAGRRFSSNELDAVSRALRENASGDIYGDQDERYLQNEITIVDRQRPTDTRQAQKPAMSMTKLSQGRENLHKGLHQIQGFRIRKSRVFTQHSHRLSNRA